MRIGKLKILEHRVIGNGPLGPLLQRWIILRHEKLGGIFLHKLCRSDHDRALHDHPWGFVSLVLRGYDEVFYDLTQPARFREQWRRNHMGYVLYRRATYRHRVVIVDKPAWTLVFVGPRVRRWGFWPEGGWCWWRKYDTFKGICEENIIHTGSSD